MSSICIIGADSFIARHFIEKLSKSNIKIIPISRVHVGLKNERTLSDLFQLESSDFIGINVVINFAGIVHQENQKDQNLYKKVNTDLPIYLAKEAKKGKVSHFIQMSNGWLF